jgi:hypothetical protein
MRYRNLSWARIVSDVLSPPAVWALMALPIAARNSTSLQDTLTWASIYIFLVAIVPTLYIALQVHRGNISDIHLQYRQERIWPFIVSTMSAALATLLLFQIHASTIMKLFAVSSLVQLSIMATITIVWQISIHTMSISGVAVTAGALFGLPVALLFVPVVILVAMARLKLERHTRIQVIAGVVIGAVSVSLLLVVAGLIRPDIWSH